VGLWLWLRHRDQFGRFVGAFTILMGTGFVIYLLFPEMPPWLAARHGLLPPVHRIVVDSLQHLGGFGRIYAGADPEPNAAMPSLHVAVPMLIACTAVGVVRRRSRLAWLWMMYPLTLGFGVTYLGEHYIADTVVELALGAACYALVERVERVAESRRGGSAHKHIAPPWAVPPPWRGAIRRNPRSADSAVDPTLGHRAVAAAWFKRR
jgi:hypothetical protein